MKILITGGCGYIGSHLIINLSLSGHEIVCVDRSEPDPRISLHKYCTIHKLDLRSYLDVSNFLENHRPDVIIHLAAEAYVGESMTFPQRYIENNVMGALNLLEAARQNNIKKFVFSSTCAAYGELDGIKASEEFILSPTNFYGLSKKQCEEVISMYCTNYSMAAVSFRFFNVAGANKLKLAGEFHDPETHLIPRLLLNILSDDLSLKVFGNDFNTKDGTAIREYVHVLDLCDAFQIVVETEGVLNLGDHKIYNLCAEDGFSVEDIITETESFLGIRINRHYEARRFGDPASLRGSYRKAFRELGWNPRRSNIQEIIHDAYVALEHFRNN